MEHQNQFFAVHELKQFSGKKFFYLGFVIAFAEQIIIRLHAVEAGAVFFMFVKLSFGLANSGGIHKHESLDSFVFCHQIGNIFIGLCDINLLKWKRKGDRALNDFAAEKPLITRKHFLPFKAQPNRLGQIPLRNEFGGYFRRPQMNMGVKYSIGQPVFQDTGSQSDMIFIIRQMVHDQFPVFSSVPVSRYCAKFLIN